MKSSKSEPLMVMVSTPAVQSVKLTPARSANSETTVTTSASTPLEPDTVATPIDEKGARNRCCGIAAQKVENLDVGDRHVAEIDVADASQHDSIGARAAADGFAGDDIDAGLIEEHVRPVPAVQRIGPATARHEVDGAQGSADDVVLVGTGKRVRKGAGPPDGDRVVASPVEEGDRREIDGVALHLERAGLARLAVHHGEAAGAELVAAQDDRRSWRCRRTATRRPQCPPT